MTKQRRSSLITWGMTLGVVCLLMCWGLGCQESEPTEYGSRRRAIINGQGDLAQPAIGALVVQRRSSFCSGTLITRQLVVTAAHCVDAVNRYGLRNVQFRTDFANSAGRFTSEHHELLQVAKHPRYTRGTGANFDIAVLVLKQPVKNVKVLPIAANRAPMQQAWIGKNVRVVGYGLIQTRPQFRSADQKYAADIPLFQINARSFIHFDGKTPEAQRKSACHGDSGGPALYTVSGKTYVMGVTSIAYRATSAGNGRTYCNGGAVSTRLDSSMDFLGPYLQKYADGPQACLDDKECGACGACGSKKLCEPKPIVNEPEACRPCRSDSDCGTGICYRFKEGYRCLQACSSASCCPSGTECAALAGTSQSKAVCRPQKSPCPPARCTSDKDCGKGEVCDQNIKQCKPNIPPRGAELCFPCKTSADCGGGLCYGPRGNGRCTQPCGDGDFCPTGFVCRALYPGVAKQCMPSDNTCKVPCSADKDCPTDFACQNQLCARKGGGITGDSCDPMPCKSGYRCIVTESGKSCMRSCGIRPGYAGANCLSGAKCINQNNGVRCYRSGRLQVCLGACQSNDQCKASGGGTCSQAGNCLCRQNSDCEQGFACNLFTYQNNAAIGACVPQDASVACGADAECRAFDQGEFCAPKGAGSRSLGQPCDSLNRCKQGLSCLYTQSGRICVENCTQSRRCTLGGRCLQYTRTAYICLCSGTDCPQGRVCRKVIQGQNQSYGYCAAQQPDKPVGCIDDKECPNTYTCDQGKCISPIKPEPKPEPTPEFSPEFTLEPDPKPEPVDEVIDSARPDAGAETKPEASVPDAKKPRVSLGGGCSCSTDTSTSSTPFSWFGLLGLFLAFGWRRKDRDCSPS